MTSATLPSERQEMPQEARTCEWCAWILRPRQRRFCSESHRKAWWEANHPRIGDRGRREVGTLKRQIKDLMADGEWRTEQQITDSIHGFAHSVGARLSELRRANEPIEVRRGPGNVKLYRWAGRA